MKGVIASELASARQAVSDETRQKVAGLFSFAAAMHQRRMPIARQLLYWKLQIAHLPINEAIEYIPCLEENAEAQLSEMESEEMASTDGAETLMLLRVGRPILSPPPEPPAELVAWMTTEWQDARTIAPEFHEARSELVESQYAEASRTIIHPFDEDATRVELGLRYREEWNTWATQERIALAAEDVFQKVYIAYTQLQREAERYELVLGDGILAWNRPDGNVRYPLLTRRVRLEFAAEIQEFRFYDDADKTEFASSLFRSMADIDGRTIATLCEQADKLDLHPLGGVTTDTFLAGAVIRLSPQGEYIGNTVLEPEPQRLVIYRDATFFLRLRSQGTAAALEAIIADIKAGAELPTSLLSIVGAHDEIMAISNTPTDRVYESLLDANEDREVLFTKPGNAEQLTIARKLDVNDSIIVQGPPGTGKTHTIANLLGHLLAQGKSVLVTSHTTKALHVLREKVVQTLQPLCLSVLNDSSRDTAELQSSVAAIAQRLGNADVEMLAIDAKRLHAQRDTLLSELRELRQQLLEARRLEQDALVIAGKSYQPIEAAKMVHDGEENDSWIPGPIALDAPLPLTLLEIDALYASNKTIAPADEAYLDGWLPELGSLPSPETVRDWTIERAQLAEVSLEEGAQLWSNEARQAHHVDELDQCKQQAHDALVALNDQARWTRSIAENAHIPSVSEMWRGLIAEIHATQTLVFEKAALLSAHTPSLAMHDDIERLAEIYTAIATEVAKTKKIPGFLSLLMHPSWKTTLAASKIAGDRKPERPEHFAALVAAADVARARAALVQRWDALIVPLGGPSLQEVALSSTPEAEAKKYIPLLENALDWRMKRWESLQEGLKSAGLLWDVFRDSIALQYVSLSEIERIEQSLHDELPRVLRFERARRRSLALDRAFAKAREDARPKSQAAKAALYLVNALEAQAHENYCEAYTEVARLLHVGNAACERRERLRVLEAYAPTWAEQIRSRIGVHGWARRMGDPASAWLWRQLHDELLRRDGISIDRLLNDIEARRIRLRATTAELVDRLAWSEQVRRTTPDQRQALKGFVAAKKKIGKGTGKNAAKHKLFAQTQMVKSRSAVPVWIMPLVSVAESVRAEAGVFDVVIIDEASQSDVTGLFALYLGKKVIVVGDAQQVSPLAVGSQIEAINYLADTYLQGVPNRELYDGKLSLYDLAEQSFGAVVPLREHFRCAPEIIAFSNRFYNGEIKPLRERGAYAQPVVSHRIVSHGMLNDVNEAEARAIASLIAAMCELPEYAETADKKPITFGVISLLGDAQAPRIEELLGMLLPLAEIERRQIRVGNPAHFQGDERHVILLSLVHTGSGEPLRLREEDLQKQRFNVAASRAQDQLWVVHSLDHLRELKSGDLRRQLIEHALDPTAALDAGEGAYKRAESPFEHDVIRHLVAAGYGESLSVQHRVGAYRIDIVITGENGNRLAVECDGDQWHRLEDLQRDMTRQADLERLGWRFVRIRGSAFYRNPEAALGPLFERLRKDHIMPRLRESPVVFEDGLVERVRTRAALWNKKFDDETLTQRKSPKRGRRKG